MQLNNQPALFLAGVRKCGTTTLFDMLARHQKIAPASAKESQFFACDAATARSNLAWYASLFGGADPERIWLDGSTWYFGSGSSAELIKQCMPSSKVVLCLRDPAKRAFSGYQHMKKQTPTKENREFDQVLDGIESRVSAGMLLFEAEDEALKDAVGAGLTDADYISECFHEDRFGAKFPTKLEDGRFSFRYLSESMYHLWLPSWEATFPDCLRIVFFEDLISRPDEVIRSILTFAGLEYDAGTAALVQQNETRQPSGKLASRLLAFRRHSKAGKLVGNLLKQAGLTSAGGHFRDKFLYGGKDKMTESQETRLRVLLADEYKYWKQRDPNCPFL